jgi:hypothetical protein
MPEAAINENGNTGATKDHIRPARRILQRLVIDRISKPHGM